MKMTTAKNCRECRKDVAVIIHKGWKYCARCYDRRGFDYRRQKDVVEVQGKMRRKRVVTTRATIREDRVAKLVEVETTDLPAKDIIRMEQRRRKAPCVECRLRAKRERAKIQQESKAAERI